MQVEQIASTSAKAGLSILESSILGAITVLAFAIAIFAIWKLVKVQDQRVKDKESTNDKMEKLMEKFITTFSKMENALTNLTQAEKDGQALLQSMKQSQETIILEAVRGRSPAPGGGG